MTSATIPDIIQNAVQKVCDRENIKNFDVQVQEEGNVKGAGFLGEITFLTIHDHTSNNDLHLVVKKAFNNESIRRVNPLRESFLNEIYFYRKVWPKLREFQNEAGISNKFTSVPKYYGSEMESHAELIILQNLKKIGYGLFDKKLPFDSDHTTLICKTYARFHAISFAMRVKQPEIFQELTGEFHDFWKLFLNKGQFLKQMIIAHCKLALEMLVPGEDDEIIRKFQRYAEDSPELFLESLNYQGKCPVINHGDSWSNNLLFRYDNTKSLTNIQLIDWQLIRVHSPTLDLSYCFYSSASQNLFDNLDHFLKLYLDNFKENLTEFGCDPSVFTMEDLKSDWRKYSKYGLIFGLILMKIKLTKDEDVIDFTDMDSLTDTPFEEVFLRAPYDEEEYKRRVRGLLRHMSEIDSL